MREPDYRGLAALAIGICGAVGIFIIVPTATIIGYKVTDYGSDVLIALGGALVGAFATYMGMRYTEKSKTDGFEDPTDTTGK